MRKYLYSAAAGLAGLALLPGPAVAGGQSQEQLTPSQIQQRIAAAQGATTLAELSTGIGRACQIASWQIALRPGENNSVTVERSPTLSRNKVSCIYVVIGNSKFWATNAQNDR